MNLLKLADAARDARKMQRLVPGLPAVRSSPLAARSPQVGATITNLDNPSPVARVQGRPSMKLERLPDGGLRLRIQSNVTRAALLDEADLASLRTIAQNMVSRARAQSQGPLSLKDLRRRGHPYGRNARGLMRGKLGRIGSVKGARGAVPNLSVVNRQTGVFAAAWVAEAGLNDRGPYIDLINESEIAAYLGMGTRRMQAHGPWTHVAINAVPAISSAIQKMVYEGNRRKLIEADLTSSLKI
jgi:hypothetical protein